MVEVNNRNSCLGVNALITRINLTYNFQNFIHIWSKVQNPQNLNGKTWI